MNTLAQRIAQDYLDTYADGLNRYINELRTITVASRETISNTSTNNSDTKKSPPVNLLSVGIPVQFQVTNLVAWAYNNEEPQELLEKIDNFLL